MAPVKRASTSAGTPQSSQGCRGAKAAKVDDPPLPVSELLGLLEGASVSSTEMMRASLPHALSTPREERHSFQSRLLEAFAEMVAQTEQRRADDVRDAQAAISRHEAEQGSAEARLSAALAQEASSAASKSTAAAEQAGSADAHRSAVERLTERELARDGLEQHRQALADARSHFEAEVAQAWVPARDGAFPPKEWRLRQKAIARTAACLGAAGAPESLVAATGHALKQNGDARTAFAVCAVQHAGKALDGFLQASLAEVEEAQRAVEDEAQCVETAAAAVAAALADSDRKSESLVAADNEWCEAASRVGDIREEIRRAGDVASGLAAGHQRAQAAQQELQAAVAKFAALRDAEPQSPPAVSPA